MAAKHFDYYDNWKEEVLVCPECGWTGTFEEGVVDDHEQLMDSMCPQCDLLPGEMLAIVSYPTIAESKANWDKLSDAGKRQVELIEAHYSDFEANRLKRPDQLPDIRGDNLIFVWDFEYAANDRDAVNTIIKHEGKVIWREPAFYECYERFEEVAQILKSKYQTRLKDLVPAEGCEVYLYGDRLTASDRVAEIRRNLKKGLKDT